MRFCKLDINIDLIHGFVRTNSWKAITLNSDNFKPNGDFEELACANAISEFIKQWVKVI